MITWTLAYRTPRANHFKRVTNWEGTWHQAYELAAAFNTADWCDYSGLRLPVLFVCEVARSRS